MQRSFSFPKAIINNNTKCRDSSLFVSPVTNRNCCAFYRIYSLENLPKHNGSIVITRLSHTQSKFKELRRNKFFLHTFVFPQTFWSKFFWNCRIWKEVELINRKPIYTSDASEAISRSWNILQSNSWVQRHFALAVGRCKKINRHAKRGNTMDWFWYK